MAWKTRKEATEAVKKIPCQTCGKSIPAVAIRKMPFGRKKGMWVPGTERKYCSTKCANDWKRDHAGATAMDRFSDGSLRRSKRVFESAPGVYDRECSKCHEVKPQTREHFYRRQKDNQDSLEGWKGTCIVCARKLVEERAEARADANDPLAVEQKLIREADYRRKRGKPEPGDESIPEPLEDLPVGPLRERIQNWMVGERGLEAFSEESGLSKRQVYRLLHEGKKVRYDTADMICINMGWMIWEIWPGHE